MIPSGESTAVSLLSHPGVQRFPSSRMELLIWRDFLSAELCKELIALIEAHHRPSTIADSNGDTFFRTSSTCDLPPDHPAVEALQDRLCSVCGIPRNHAEPLQGQRYEVGQEFKAHTDYFEPQGADYAKYCTRSGQRTWTLMIYLNEVEAGGATRFKVIDKLIQPETGKLIAWNNRRPDDTPNAATLHHAMKVRKGNKYIVTQWFREQPWR
jgi:2OG-Fe(II) oxygenase superfamily.